ncbi:hypothetical protein M413DRAFT_409397 [Hebeloma cylindrosporum]|uniref:Oxysterol-binding protein n=1 Tax=Hebeloma cylindrosporum TaxID=76867 RepID=A0A0C3CF38_HEBCY|nr:hypothetical protein M413DRAFT_409397 [Hebeloma cylindrosporum h7]
MSAPPIHDSSAHDDDDAPGPPISVPDSGDTGEGGKLKMIVQLVKKCLGVKDIAAMRLSLPASLLEPIPNLEYWNYLDRPDVFAAINDSDDPFLRMLAVLRFVFTKDLKFVHGKICKPYNSVLGEHFRAHWDVVPNPYTPDEPDDTIRPEEPWVSETGSVKSFKSVKSGKSSKSTTSGISAFSKRKSPSTAPTSPQQLIDDDNSRVAAQVSNLSLTHNNSTGTTTTTNAPSSSCSSPDAVRIIYLTEQVSHHPPISAYFASMSGIDQISAKVSGTTLRVAPGQFNQGIFVHLTGGHGAGERYRLTHPVASVNGILRGSFYATISESTIITCEGGKPGHKFRTVVEYKEESWLGRAHYLCEGVIHTVFESDANHCAEWTRVKHVPRNRVVAAFEGCWKGKIRWKRVGTGSYPPTPDSNNINNINTNIPRSTSSSPSPSHEKLPTPSIASASRSKADISSGIDGVEDGEWMELIDVSRLGVIPKAVRPLERQQPRESRKLWENVTERLMKKEFSEATREKVMIEQRQRDEAAERKKKGVEFVPRYFSKDLEKGYADLTDEGWAAVEEEIKEDTGFCIEGIDPKATLAG